MNILVIVDPEKGESQSNADERGEDVGEPLSVLRLMAGWQNHLEIVAAATVLEHLSSKIRLFLGTVLIPERITHVRFYCTQSANGDYREPHTLTRGPCSIY